MDLRNNDVLKLNGDVFVVVEKKETESKETYVLLYCLTRNGEVTICKMDKETETLVKIQNDYLFTKLMQNFNERLKNRMLNEHNIKIVEDDEEK